MRRLVALLESSFQAKVLIPVVGLMVVFPTVTLWVLQHRVAGTFEQEARQRLAMADAVFKNSIAIRQQSLLSRYRNAALEPRFRSAAQTLHEPTIMDQFRERFEEWGEETEVILFQRVDGSILAGASRPGSVKPEALAQAAAVQVQAAAQGKPGVRTVAVGNALFDAVSVPVIPMTTLDGVLTVGVRIRHLDALEFKSLTQTEIVLLAGERVSVSTLAGQDGQAAAAALLNGPGGAVEPVGSMRSVVAAGERFLALTGSFGDGLQGGPLRYVLLHSDARALAELHGTQNTLWLIGLVGLLLSTGVVWLAVRRIMEPIRRLRAGAEAVGRQEFSHRVEVTSRDECGKLAEAFNQMTDNLRTSRSELEATLDTLKSTQARLIQSEKLSGVGEFVAGVAHELNNPLTTVIGFSELLHESTVNAEDRQYADHIVQSALRCRRIVQNLLTFARRHTPERKLIDLNETIKSVIDLVAYELRTGNITLHQEFDPDLPKISADAHQLQQVFLNLVNNARQAMESQQRDGWIRVKTSLKDERTVLARVMDGGPGIARDHLDKVFDPFFTTKPVGQGTGLGLSLSYGIIKEHGGNISVESEPGKGATFLIELPVPGVASTGADGPQDSRAIRRVPGRGQRVLVIDDEPHILELTRAILARDGYEVEIAQDGELALARAAAVRFDLILCDWKLPGLSGPQIYRKLAARDPEAARRVVFVTADVISPSFQSFLEQHDRPCLPKPFTLEQLRSVVAASLKEAG